MNEIKRTKIQEIVALFYENTNRLLKELAMLKKIAMEDRQKIVEELEKKGLLDDILAYLKEEADEGDRVSLNVFNLWKYGQFPESGNKGHGVSK